MRQHVLLIFLLVSPALYAQRMTIITHDHSKVEVAILTKTEKTDHLRDPGSHLNNSLRKKWTARTYTLSNGSILIEFFNREEVLIKNISDFHRLERVRFVKNTVDFLKKNISYKIELTFDEGNDIVRNDRPKQLTQYKSDMPDLFDFNVYELTTGQILLVDKSIYHPQAAIYPDLKTLSSERSNILEQVYSAQNEDEYLMKRLAAGDRLEDYVSEEQLIYPKYLNDIIKHHQLKLIEKRIYVSSFFGNLYESAKGYFILIDEPKQENGAGTKMPILSLRIYDNLQHVREAQARYYAFANRGVTTEHCYKQISDRYGKDFPRYVEQLTDSLPALFNFDPEQLAFDSAGIDMVDEAIKWNWDSTQFDTWFPAVLAYYGQCYINVKQESRWDMLYDEANKVWIPEVKLNDGTFAWYWLDFYKGLLEAPIPLRWAGDWDGAIKHIRDR